MSKKKKKKRIQIQNIRSIPVGIRIRIQVFSCQNERKNVKHFFLWPQYAIKTLIKDKDIPGSSKFKEIQEFEVHICWEKLLNNSQLSGCIWIRVGRGSGPKEPKDYIVDPNYGSWVRLQDWSNEYISKKYLNQEAVLYLDPDSKGSEPFCRIRIRIIGSDPDPKN